MGFVEKEKKPTQLGSSNDVFTQMGGFMATATAANINARRPMESPKL